MRLKNFAAVIICFVLSFLMCACEPADTPVLGGAAVADTGYEWDLAYAAHGIGDDELFWDNALNADNSEKGGAQHLPIFKFESAEEFEDFKTGVLSGFYLNEGHNDVPSLKSITSECDEEFFKENTLFLIYVPATSGSVRHKVSEVTAEDGVFTAEITADSPPAVTMDLVSWFLTVKANKDYVSGCTEFNAYNKKADAEASAFLL